VDALTAGAPRYDARVSTLHAHLVQMDIVWEDRSANYRKVRSLLSNTRVEPGDLVVLPEMFDTGFSFNIESTADTDVRAGKPESGATLEFLRALAADLRATVHGSRTVIGPDARGRNMATIVAPSGALLCEYAKIHPFSYGRETERFTGGDTVVTYPWTRAADAPVAEKTLVCPAVCYDLRFPELFRLGLKAGAEVYALGSNWPAPREFHRRTLSIARAIENQAFVLSVNRVGKDPALAYAGGTLAVGPRGDVLAELGDTEGVLSVPVDLLALREWRQTFPAWRDTRLVTQLSGAGHRAPGVA
jgi:predicted amidohydrolase